MKILLIGDASNYHATLGRALAAKGHDVTVASNGSRWMQTGRDIDLSRPLPGRAGGALLWLKLNTILAHRLKGYDVVQLSNPIFLDLKPGRVAEIFRRLRSANGGVFLTALGTDTAFVDTCLNTDALRYSEWQVEGRPTPFTDSERGRQLRRWLDEPLRSHSQRVYDEVAGVVTALYEYHVAMERYIEPNRLAYGGIPIDTETIPFLPAGGHNEPLRVLAPYHAGREGEKGTDILYEAVRNVPGIHIDRVTGLTFDDFRRRLEDCDVVLDQLYSYTPATTALMAMAMGKTVVTGAEAAFADWIGDRIPAINPDPADPSRLATDLARALTPEAMATRAAEARRFVERHNSKEVVAERFTDFWESCLR